MKRIIRNAFEWLGLEISKRSPKTVRKETDEVIHLSNQNRPLGRALLAYVLEPFMVKDKGAIATRHTHHQESLRIAKVMLDMGYELDVISYLNSSFVPKSRYDLFISARTHFKRIAGRLNGDCIKIAHLDTSHWISNNKAAYERYFDLQQRRGVSVRPRKMIEPNYAIEAADYATLLGNRVTESTYAYAGKPIFRVGVPTVTLYESPAKKNFEACRRNFLWLGSDGVVNKGLDLVLDVFSQMPQYNLYVCGPVQEEKEFETAFTRELYETPNIVTVGWVDVTGSKFSEIVESCVGLIYPSCAEGQSGAVLTCMQSGLIPIISRQSGVDVEDFGLVLPSCAVDDISRTIQAVSAMPAEELRDRSVKSWKAAREGHSIDRFEITFREAISRILDLAGRRST